MQYRVLHNSSGYDSANNTTYFHTYILTTEHFDLFFDFIIEFVDFEDNIAEKNWCKKIELQYQVN